MTSVRADTPFPTPTGWKFASELKPGDFVFAGDGQMTQVVVVNVEKPKAALEVKMVLDPVVVSDDHDLVIGLPWYGTWIGPPKQIEERLHRLRKPLASVKRVRLQLPEVELPLDPWTYGYWRVLHLPDGVIGVKEHLVEKAIERLSSVGLTVTKQFRDRDMVYLTSNDLAALLEKIGEWPGFHPDYLRAGENQRRELMAGVIDARGRFMNGITVETSRPVVEAVAEITMSLGLRASMPNKGLPRVRMSPHDAVMILRKEELDAFLSGPKRPGYRMEVPYMIRQATPAPGGDFVQIKTVDGTYLVSKAMIPSRDF